MITSDDIQDAIGLLSDTDKAYLAGIIDGEGCVCIYNDRRVKGHRHFGLVLSISNTDIRLVNWIKEKIPTTTGKAHTMTRREDKQIYSIQYHGMKAGIVLNSLLDYLIIKKERAEIAILFLMSDFDEREKLHDKMKMLNKKGS